MNSFLLNAQKISKSFNAATYLFRDLNIELANKDIIAVTGVNGSGKTTLLKILAGAMTASIGKVELEIDGNDIKKEDHHNHIGYVAPYLNLYEEFTPIEHLKLFNKIRGIKDNETEANDLLKKFALFKKRHHSIRTFSSGMKQRMKYIVALIHKPEILLLDEPMSNLDSEGVSTVLNIIFSHLENGGGIILATNEKRDKALCKKFIKLEKK